MNRPLRRSSISPLLSVTTLGQAVALGLAVTLAGCAGLPDQRLANEAMQNGDTALAERNYRQLAELGYSDAQVGLADIQVASGDPARLKEAEATYRAAAATSPRAQSRLGRLLAAKPDATDAERKEAQGLLQKAFASGESGSLLALAMLYLQYPHSFPEVNAQQQISQWRSMGYAEAGLAQIVLYRTQGTYEQHLDEVESICKQALASTDMCYVELATVYQTRGQADQQKALLDQLRSAYSAGRVDAQRVDSVARVLGDAQVGSPDPQTAQQLLEGIAPGYPVSWVTLAKLLYDFPELGDVDKMMEYLDNGRAADQPRAELLLGRLYYEGKWVPADAKKAEQHLSKASASELSAHYYLGQLYRRGYLGQVYPQKAVDELLLAARGGQASADFALAQLFSQGRGIKPDLVNAWVFSQLAKTHNPTPQADELAQQINPQLSPAQLAAAQQLLQREQKARGATASQNALVLQTLQKDDGEEAL
ncbi:alginate biosynthesis TPR repeat lipoprotein AlgK [Pseudomonas sp. 21LCFQ02]|uniref:alginate biosynthesis TPR repeat lipoprotein AlgK n=1 Tax=unclassified Pseudomonas TaxID=196821 RepID=UPI00209ABCC1|nr:MULTISPECIES: alginate biosynthesis TPR repeat lipoprotein AlgK [unclassified Pseudomonas]MCO8168129.1 alginate biosynthesis TPR repeat lipoprotein AlgK [Pseudomonas sp. 21LCFQ02]MCQ9423737.1 alginate biosynthesis TPR repeat lipoprotein AlgK [Pseudomonas sp. LJDD11]